MCARFVLAVVFCAIALTPALAPRAAAQAHLFTPDEQVCLGLSARPHSIVQQINSCTAVIQNPSTGRITRAQAYGARAAYSVGAGQPRRAIDDTNEELRLYPEMPVENLSSALALRGWAYALLGQYDLALADFDRALTVDPRSDEAAIRHSMRAFVHLSKRDYDRAIADFDQALALSPKDVDVMIARGRTYAMKGDHARSIVDYDAALRLQPDQYAAIGNRGIAHLRLGNHDQAIADLKRALALKSDWLWAREHLREAEDAKSALLARARAAPTGKRLALVIGNGRYQHIARLANAENDAADVAAALRAMGYQVFGHPRVNFTRAEMEAEIAAFQRAAAGADAALVWYAGHGQEFREQDEIGRNWLLPVDARIERLSDVYAQGVAMSRLITSAEPARSLRVVVIDACRNSTLPSATRAIGPRLAVEQRSGMMIVFSTRSGTVALDGEGRNSPFAAAFLEAARDKSRLDVRQFFGAVSAGTLARTRNAQEPELLVRLQTDAALPLEP